MAIGATESDVQQQFLIEAVVLSLMGGILGIIFGLSTSSIISQVLRWPTLNGTVVLMLFFRASAWTSVPWSSPS